ncbi:tRNA (cytosine(38)-C(5))-methyltransferase [Nasonia vitripennis]|uniref:tRNA (cytosine(38)-C(5))-methyltransferase n=1 Tax=Nasonia vitripennis TaxID=7425 RepID=A0A7M7G3M3_NASVI|nr:tRNA (cytosine(38)-C(5))-methyltransferase [Nasonia vitripennis]
MRVLELYSGIGGMHYALQESSVTGKIITSIDINTTANKVYRHNFPETANISRNIESVTVEEIAKLHIDCILMSPPCQPFTRIGLKKDSDDNRCLSLLHILQIIPHIESLDYILLENVKGFESSQARNEVILCLEKSGFNYKELILSPCQFGIPNSRHRYYLIAKRKGLKFIFDDASLITSIPEKVLELLPKNRYTSVPLEDGTHSSIKSKGKCFKLKYILESNVVENFLIPGKILLKRGSLLDIRTPESSGSCCFTKAYSHYVEGTGSVFSPSPDFEIKKKFEEINKSSETPEDKMQALLGLKLRYFTPKEVSRLMCFPENFEFPNDLSNKQKYRLLGNSINVHVVSQLIYLLYFENSVSLT